MGKYLFYGMTQEKMCFLHVLMNAVDMHNDNKEVKIIFEGASVKLVPILEQEQNQLYLKSKQLGLIAGVCLACSKALGVYEEIAKTDLVLLDDMMGHAGMNKYINEGYEVISI